MIVIADLTRFAELQLRNVLKIDISLYIQLEKQ